MMVDGSETASALRSRSQLLDETAIAFGGRAAEGIVLVEPGAGSAIDLERASKLARYMVIRLGIIDEAAARAHAVLIANRDGFGAVAEALIERETLTAEDLDDLAGPPQRPATGGSSRSSTKTVKKTVKKTASKASGGRTAKSAAGGGAARANRSLDGS